MYAINAGQGRFCYCVLCFGSHRLVSLKQPGTYVNLCFKEFSVTGKEGHAWKRGLGRNGQGVTHCTAHSFVIQWSHVVIATLLQRQGAHMTPA